MRIIGFAAFLALAACMPVQNAGLQPQAPTQGWVMEAPGPPDRLGRAYVTNAEGVTLSVACGNGGTAGINLTPDPRLARQREISNAILMFSVDGGRQRQLPAGCSASGCYQDFMLGGEPWPARETSRIVSALRKGSNVDVFLGGQVIQSFSLSGSSRVLESYRRAAGNCEGL
ncbi:MAG: hypothetical protein AB8B85_07745 [Paracoccaceae bacterium]